MTRGQQALSGSPARVLIVDDHPAVREALKFLLASSSDLSICGEADDVNEALRLFQTLKPDIGLIDIALKSGDGLGLIKQLRARDRKVRLLVWSMYSEECYAQRVLRAGAQGYLNKTEATDQVVVALRQILTGKRYLSPTLAERLLQGLVGQREVESRPTPFDCLSDRELELMRFLGQGLRIPELAARMHLSAATVETYCDRVRIKLGLSDRKELTRQAWQWALPGSPASVPEPLSRS